MYILEIQATHLKIQLRTVLKIEFVVKMYGDMSILSQSLERLRLNSILKKWSSKDRLYFWTLPTLYFSLASCLTVSLMDTNFKLMNS